MLGQPGAPQRDWVFAGNMPKAAIRGREYLVGADGKMYDIRETPYQPKLLAREEFTEEQQARYTQLKSAMDGLDHPYTKGLGVGRKTKKVKNQSDDC